MRSADRMYACLKKGLFCINVDDPTAPRTIAEITDTLKTDGGPNASQHAVGQIIAKGETAARTSDIYAVDPRVTLEKRPGRDGQCVVVYHPAAKLLKGIRSGRRYFSVRKYGEQDAWKRAQDTAREWSSQFAHVAINCDTKSICFCSDWPCPLNQPGNDHIHARDWCAISENNTECKLLRGLNNNNSDGSAAAVKRSNIGVVIRARHAGGILKSSE